MNLLRSRLSGRFALGILLTIGVTFLAIGYGVETGIQKWVKQEAHSKLFNATTLLVERFPNGFEIADKEDLQNQIVRLGKAITLRITLVSPDGTVLADSYASPPDMENHRDRPEILAAIAGVEKEADRYSYTTHKDLVYYAQAIRVKGELRGVVRTALPRSEIANRLFEVRKRLAYGFGVGLLACFSLWLWLSRRLVGSLSRVTEVAAALEDPRSRERVDEVSNDELGRLGGTLNSLAEKVRKRSEEYEEEVRKLREVLASLSEGVLTIDEEGKLLFWNLSALRLLGVTGVPQIGQMAALTIRVSAVLEMADHVLNRMTAIHREVVLYRDDQEVTLEVDGIPLHLPRNNGVLVVLREVTDRAKVEKIRQDFVANASHELKTPVTVMKGYIETLLSGADRDEETRQRFLSQISKNVNHLVSLIDDLLALSRAESWKQRLELVKVDCVSIVREIAEQFRSIAKQKGIDFHVTTDEEATQEIYARSNREVLGQVVRNLIDNAIKYTPSHGRVEVRIGSENHRVTIRVVDTGIGIPKSDLDRVFERFYRVDRARSSQVEGTGLGLSIVKHVMEDLEGTIDVASEVDKGSTFTVRLPS